MKLHPILLLAMLWLTLPAIAQQSQQRGSLSIPNTNELDNFVEKLINDANIPGLSLAIVREGKIIYSNALGVKSADTQESIDQETIFAAASLSKPLFAYGVMKLVETGEFDLDKPLYEYMEYPDISSDERYKQITGRMALSHASGFPNWRRGDLAINFQPGEKFSYSGEGFVYLQKVIEKITGKEIDEWMQEMVFTPLNMDRSSYLWKEDYANNFAMPHNDLKRTFPKYKPKEGNAAHSLQTTATNYANFMNALIEYQGLQQETVENMLSPQINVDETHSGTVNWGVGIGLQKVEKIEAFWHWGDNGTFKCFVIGFPLYKTGLVYFTNSSNGLGIAPVLLSQVFGARFPALEWIDYEAYNSPTKKIVKAALEGNFTPVMQQYLHRSGKHQDTLLINERAMNNLGYNLMGLKLMNEAKKVFQMNMEAFPNSSNVYDSYAEVCLKTGDRAKAAQYYAKAAEMDPQNKIAATIVERLQLKNHKGNASFRLESYSQALHVSLAGSFNGWNALSHPFIWKDGAWTNTLQLEPGDYEYKIIVDSVWIPDPNNKIINLEDNFNSKLTVE